MQCIRTGPSPEIRGFSRPSTQARSSQCVFAVMESATSIAKPESFVRLSQADTHVFSVIDTLVHDGLRLVLEVLLAFEADAYVARHRDCRDANGRAMVTRNGVARGRLVPMGPASIVIHAPRVNDRRVVDGRRQRYASTILPPNRAPAVGGAHKLANAFLRGWATGDFSAVSSHLASYGVVGAREAAAALGRKWVERSNAPLYDLRFSRAFAAAVPCGSPVELEPLSKSVLLIVGALSDGRLQLLEIGLGDPDSRDDWSTLLRKARAHGLMSMPDVSDPPSGAFHDAVARVFGHAARCGT